MQGGAGVEGEDISGMAAMHGGAGMKGRIFLAWPPCKVVVAWKGAYFWQGRHARWCWHGKEDISGMAAMQGGAGMERKEHISGMAAM
jgi:hypothetical protein